MKLIGPRSCWGNRAPDGTMDGLGLSLSRLPSFSCPVARTHPKVAGGEPVTGRDRRACTGVSIVRVYVRQQGGHHRWHSWAMVLRGEAVKMPGKVAEK